MRPDHVMLLIDGDNVSADLIEQAVAWAHQHHGGPHVRRAYCTAESAVRQQAMFKRLGIRPMVNLAAGKNSTDIALAIDAIDLATSERPEVMIIVSSDSDFAPLVVRLREKGCRVVGIGQHGKTGDETRTVYDDFVVLAHRKPAAKAKSRPARKAPAPAPAAPPAPAVPEKARALLDALPELRAGQTLELNVAAERLRKAELLSRRGSSTKLFGSFPDIFELRPEKQPNQVRLRAPG